jgi:hypothetical protein
MDAYFKKMKIGWLKNCFKLKNEHFILGTRRSVFLNSVQISSGSQLKRERERER